MIYNQIRKEKKSQKMCYTYNGKKQTSIVQPMPNVSNDVVFVVFFWFLLSFSILCRCVMCGLWQHAYMWIEYFIQSFIVSQSTIQFLCVFRLCLFSFILHSRFFIFSEFFLVFCVFLLSTILVLLASFYKLFM